MKLSDIFPFHKKKPITEEVSKPSVPTRYSSYPSVGLNPVRLAAIFREADQGDILRQSELFEDIEEKDPHLYSQLQTRKNAVTGLDYEVIAFDSNSEQDKQIAEFVNNEIQHIENFDEVLLDLLDAIGKGISFSEIIWKQDATGTHIQDIKNVHQKLFYWDENDAICIRTKEYPEGIELPENKFIIHKYKARSGHPARAGILRVVAWMYMFKNYDVKDWVTFAEIYGMPMRLGKYDTSASEADKEALMRALIQLGTDAAGMVPDTTDILFQESSKTSSADIYERLARYCDEQMSKAILGQTLTSDSGGGSYAQSKTHNEVRHDLTAADCKALSATLRKYLFAPLVRFNFGESANVPYIKFDYEESEDQKMMLDIYTGLSNMGLKISSNFLYSKFGIPIPENGEEIVTRTVTSAFPFKQVALKDKDDPLVVYQKEVDALSDEAVSKHQNYFKDMETKLKKLIDGCSTLDEALELLEDPEVLDGLLATNTTELEDDLIQAMVKADLKGRMLEPDGD